MAVCPYCEKEIELLNDGKYQCNNSECVLFRGTIRKTLTLREFERYADYAKSSYPKYKLGGGKIHYGDKEDKNAVHTDIKAVGIARDALISRSKWNELSERAKNGDTAAREKQWEIYGQIKAMMGNPGFFQNIGDKRLEKVSAKLASAAVMKKHGKSFSYGEVLAGANLALKENIFTKKKGELGRGWRDRLRVFRRKGEDEGPPEEGRRRRRRRDDTVPGMQPQKECPDCQNRYPLNFMNAYSVRTRNPIYHCSRCRNIYELEGNGNLTLQHAVDVLPENCPVCGNALRYSENKNEPGIWRIYCTNPACQPGLEPWHIDLQRREFDQWLDVRRNRLRGQVNNFEQWMQTNRGYNPNGRSRQDISRVREFKAIRDNIDSYGFTNIDPKRLFIDQADVPNELRNDFEQLTRERREQIVGKEGEVTKRDEDEASQQSRDVHRKARDRGLLGATSGILTRATHYGTHTGFSALLALIGIIVGTFFGWQFIVAFAAWAARNMIPDPKPLEMRKDFETNRMGSLFARDDSRERSYDNRYSSGLAVTKSLLKLVILFFLGWGFLNTELPFRGFMLLVFFFAAYFSLPGEYSPTEPQRFMEGLMKPVVAIILAFVVFRGVFQSWELASLCLAFFFVFPLPTERENIARAIGTGLSGISATYENIDKLLFLALMLWGLVTMGLIPGFGGGGLVIEWGTIFSNIFFPFWIVALIGGLVSPASVRPHTGIIMLIMVFIFFGLGEGEQLVGQGFFGTWWPTIHNAMTSFAGPIGEGFSAIGSTFGQTFSLLTNPVGYAHSVMEGTYEQNPTGITGSYGVEIEQLMIPAIYPGTDAIATFNVKNVGPMAAEDVIVTMALPADLAIVVPLTPNFYAGSLPPTDAGYVEDFNIMEPSFAVPLYFNIKAENCSDINEIYGNWWTTWGSSDQKTSLRNHYIRVNATVEYDYSVESWMALDMISTQEWRDRTARGTFTQSKVISHVSTSPARLSIGSFEQPIVTGNRPFYIALNLTSAEGPNSEILWDDPITKISFVIPTEVEKNFNAVDPCKPPYDGRMVSQGTVTLTWNGAKLKNKAAFCFADSLDDFTVPSKTFYIRANATFRFKKWETKDTLFAFDDVCG